MRVKPKITIADHFFDLEDPRIERTKHHQLIDIITLSLCAVICGADTWVDIESYGRAKYEWLKKILELPNGIPSHDTIARVFSRLKPEQFQKCFLSWIQSISCFTPGEVIAIDGKTLRHSYDRAIGKAKKIWSNRANILSTVCLHCSISWQQRQAARKLILSGCFERRLKEVQG